MRSVLEKVVDLCESNQLFALATLIASEGSTPAKLGAKMIVGADGSSTGTIGGGALEGQARDLAVEALRTLRPVAFDFSLQGEGPPVADPICGGLTRVLVDPLIAGQLTAYRAAALAREQHQRGLLLTRLTQSGGAAKELNVATEWLDESALASHTGFPDAETLRDILRHETNESCTRDNPETGERLEVLVEAIAPQPRLLIVGGGHVGQAVARQAAWVGFDITILEDRQEFCNPALFPAGTTTICGETAKELDQFRFATDSYIVLVTRGHKSDAEALEICLKKPHAYLGMIGSRRKVALVRKAFLESGRCTDEEFDRVYTPIGLDLGALTVPEIGTSIVAQLIAVRRKGSASGMPR